MVVVYRLSPLTYLLGRRLVHVNTFAMANLIAGRQIVPELIQEACTAPAIAEQVMGYLTDPGRVEATRAALREVRSKRGGPGASSRAAEAVLRVALAGSQWGDARAGAGPRKP